MSKLGWTLLSHKQPGEKIKKGNEVTTVNEIINVMGLVCKEMFDWINLILRKLLYRRLQSQTTNKTWVLSRRVDRIRE